MKTAISLLNEIIHEAQHDDMIHKAQAIKNNKASQSVGESWMLFHLKTLKQLLESYDKKRKS